MRRFLLLTALLIVAASYTTLAQPDRVYLCEGVLPLEVPPDIPLDFQGLYFDSGLDGSGGAVTLYNKTDKSIANYIAVIEFVGPDGDYLVSAPVHNMDDARQINTLDPRFKLWLLRNRSVASKNSIPARSDSRNTFNVWFPLLTCPAS